MKNTRIPLTRPGLMDIFWQAKRDLLGKDVQQNTTWSYVWTSDQTSHFFLGFVPTILAYWFFAFLDHHGIHTPFAAKYGMVYSGLLVMAFWADIELFDFYDSKKKANASSGYFKFNSGNLAWNVITALFYFAGGACCSAAIIFGPGTALVAVSAFFFGHLPMAVWWLRKKIIFQQAGLLYLYRLPNFNGNISGDVAAAVGTINDFCSPPSSPLTTDIAAEAKHMVISGPINTGKTSLANGIGTEFAFSGGIGRYTTMSQLVQTVFSEENTAGGRIKNVNQEEFKDGRILWRWELVDLLLVDGIDELYLSGLFSPSEGKKFTNKELALEEYSGLFEIIRQIPRVVWIIGDSVDLKEFQKFLTRTFGENAGIYTVCLKRA